MSSSAPNAIAQPNLLCSLCKLFWKRVTCLQLSPKDLHSDGDGVPPMPQHVLHAHRRSEVVSSADLGCHFCAIIIGAIAGCTGDHGGREVLQHDGPIYISVATICEDKNTYLLTIFGCGQDIIADESQILNGHTLQLRPFNETPKSANAPSHQPLVSWLQTSTFSEATANLVKAWILECQETHLFCGDNLLMLSIGPGRPAQLPRRLLDLQVFKDEGRIQLVEPEAHSNLEYCAVSYSWGFSQPYNTTSTNLVDHLKEIHINCLPKLLQDAIRIARGINFRYLWIDSLCVMQDGHVSSTADDDWRDQIGKINDIFGNAVVTIAASECFDGASSIITSRNPLSQIACRLYPSTSLPFEVVPTCTPHCISHPFDQAQYHLDSRAWVFQERILSPRTLHFTRNFLHLECRSELRCEAMAVSDCHHSGAVPKAAYNTLFSMMGPDGLPDFAVDGFVSFWQALMRRYSKANLRRKLDFLVALAGLGRQVHDKSGLTWSFGLWREHILRELLWYVRKGRGEPCRERAPTWSWASIDVRGAEIMHEPATEFLFISKITDLPEPSAFGKPLAVCGNEARYVVQLMGPLRAGAPDSSRHNRMGPFEALPDEFALQIHRSCQALSNVHQQCPFHPDTDLPEDIELYSLLVAHVSGIHLSTNTPQGWKTEVGLVLTPVPGYHGRYRRVGYFHRDVHQEMVGIWRDSPSLFENAEMTNIEIV